MSDKCRKCKKPIMWLKHYLSGGLNPVEIEPLNSPERKGNLVIDREKGIYRIATPAEVGRAVREKKNLYISHFATCEFAESFRKK
jgi:hypothetical protein